MIGCVYVVKSVNKDGSISRAPETKVTRRYRFAVVAVDARVAR